MGDTAATSGMASSRGIKAPQLAMDRGRCARGSVCCRLMAPDAGTVDDCTTSSRALTVMWAWAPSVFSRVLRCKPVISAEM